jgi:hypothetical protein
MNRQEAKENLKLILIIFIVLTLFVILVYRCSDCCACGVADRYSLNECCPCPPNPDSELCFHHKEDERCNMVKK